MVSVGHIVPMKSKIEIDIPPDYINKEIEIVILPVEKTDKVGPKEGSIRNLKGILGNVGYEKKMKEKAWESAVEEKFLSD
jgi:hypothetical protein